MPKAEAGTPKWLANKMKSKGLQKLRWYCQMCEKQCRDENGFKCHTSSESHQRQLLLFAENPHRYLDEFSSEFKTGYVELLRRRYGTRRVNANQVYQEYISSKDHLHMNATKWLSLTSFVKWLGREGICVVDETEKGWFVTWVDREPETIARQQAAAKKRKMDKDDDERMSDFIAKQVERVGASGKDDATYSELQRDEDEKLSLKLNVVGSAKPKTEVAANPSVFKIPEIKFSSASSVRSFSSTASSKERKRKSALEELREEQERFKEKKFHKDYWLLEGIVVKVITKDLGDKYYKQKGVVIQIIDKYAGVIKLLETGHKLKLDQDHLETVIPSPGRTVRILNGEFRGSDAILKSVDMDKFAVKIQICSGSFEGKVLKDIGYAEISKVHVEPS
ncbi:DNA/RNA-binding protein KIN17 [Folsomia candida]|uniref:DNA/RNA-binding protein KIN17 n=1 Tax=Folsomia candida TaxID=158441 RepID=A0A226DEA9_FOLCA|nr:DNA/RNA-binding protein KIN17 [Folsomia candida]OXA43925.1 DNA/RNA-binding protein KIN17 [Folsomia candida]